MEEPNKGDPACGSPGLSAHVLIPRRRAARLSTLTVMRPFQAAAARNNDGVIPLPRSPAPGRPFPAASCGRAPAAFLRSTCNRASSSTGRSTGVRTRGSRTHFWIVQVWLSLSSEALLTLQPIDLPAGPGPFFPTPTEENKHTQAKHPFCSGVAGLPVTGILPLLQSANIHRQEFLRTSLASLRASTIV